jgi:hypothetical protein
MLLLAQMVEECFYRSSFVYKAADVALGFSQQESSRQEDLNERITQVPITSSTSLH